MSEIKIKLLADCPENIPALAKLWFNELGRHYWADISFESIVEKMRTHLNRDTLPLTLVGFYQNEPVGMCSLRLNDGLPSELTPWLGNLVVDPHYQQQGIGATLIESIKQTAREMGYQTLYLFVLDLPLAKWYKKLGWLEIARDNFQSYPVIVMKLDL